MERGEEGGEVERFFVRQFSAFSCACDVLFREVRVHVADKVTFQQQLLRLEVAEITQLVRADSNKQPVAGSTC